MTERPEGVQKCAQAEPKKHPFSFGRRFSLGRNKQHQYVYRRGKSYPGKHLVLVYLRAKTLRVGFSTSSKVGNAVTRNRIRRFMREDFRHMRPELKPGKYIFIARTTAPEAGHQALARDMKALLSRAKLFREEGQS